MISAVICMSLPGVDTSVTCHVLMHCFGSFLLQVTSCKPPNICFQGTKHESNREDVIYLFLIKLMFQELDI